MTTKTQTASQLDEHHCVQLVPLFAALEPDELAQLEQVVHHQHFAKGDSIISPYADQKLAIVAKGALKMYQISPNGREQLLRVTEPGGYEGEQALFGASNDNLYGDALLDTTICFLRKTDFTQLLLAQPALSLRLLQINATKARATEHQASFLMMEAVETRLTSYLLDLAKAADSKYITLPMKMKDLAAFIGTTPETLSRKFKRLEDERLIERAGKSIKIYDTDALEDAYA